LTFGTYMNVHVFDRWLWADRVRQFVDRLFFLEIRWRIWCLIVPSSNRPMLYSAQPHATLRPWLRRVFTENRTSTRARRKPCVRSYTRSERRSCMRSYTPGYDTHRRRHHD